VHVVSAQGGPREQIKMLHEIAPMEGVWHEVEKWVVGGQIYDQVATLYALRDSPRDAHALDAVLDLAGDWDLLEMWLVAKQKRESPYRVTIYLDGNRQTTVNVYPNEKACFVSVPVSGVRALTLDLPPSGDSDEVGFVNARLVRGRKQASGPNDLPVYEGQLVYIERPGEYRIHVVRP